VTSISFDPTRDDGAQFLCARTSDNGTPDALDASLEADFLEKIPEVISEMWVVPIMPRNPIPDYELIDIYRFLLTSLNTESIFQESSIICPRVQELNVYRVNLDKVSLLNSLYRASFGINGIVVYLKVEGCDMNKRASMGNTPLAWAGGNGHDGVVKLLLGRHDIDPS